MIYFIERNILRGYTCLFEYIRVWKLDYTSKMHFFFAKEKKIYYKEEGTRSKILLTFFNIKMWIKAPTRSMTFDLTSLTTIKTFTPSTYVCLHRLIYHRRMHISPLALSRFSLIYLQPCAAQFLNSTDIVILLRLI